jgi:uncharacterized coiled-coil DUF342 family protein
MFEKLEQLKQEKEKIEGRCKAYKGKRSDHNICLDFNGYFQVAKEIREIEEDEDNYCELCGQLVGEENIYEFVPHAEHNSVIVWWCKSCIDENLGAK